MKTLPIALQLYTVRQELADDFDSVLRQIAAMGYAGVEPVFGQPGASAARVARLCTELGLVGPSAHVPLPDRHNLEAVLEYAALFGLRRVVAMKGAADFATQDDIRRGCDKINQAYRLLAENGISLAYHNHWWEFLDVEGRNAFDLMLDCLDEAVEFEIDVYWVQTAGLDPAAVLRRLGPRAPLVHVKDGPAVRDAPMVALGKGTVDIPGVISASQGSAQWLIVELDRCATSMLESVAQSFRYLVEGGFGHGRQG